MAISGALHTAHENLLRVIPKPLTAEEEDERVRAGKGHPDVDPAALCERALQFVDAFSADPAAAAELTRRGTLCATLTGKGSAYCLAGQQAQKALAGWDVAAQFAQEPAGLLFLQKTVRILLNAAGEELVARIRGRYEWMNRLLAEEGLPEAIRPLLENWRDAAWSIVSKGENESLDGCYWLLHAENLACDPENLKCAPENRKYASPVLAADVRQAAEALVRWCDAGPSQSQRGADVKTVRIFLASSSELREDRDAFDLYFRQQNDRLRKEGLYLEIVRCENFLDAMSCTRLQDEYNEAVRRCDVFVSLFKTKAGKYTEEEFEVAHQTFQRTGKPLIYTYFQKATVSTSPGNRDDLTSLWDFQKKLRELGHFCTEYESIAGLQKQFRDQLDMLLAEDRVCAV
jgi:hypothetical protein